MHPQLFQQGDDLFPIVIVDEVPEELVEEAEDAADICPASAIHLAG
jgi:ferredoxin